MCQYLSFLLSCRIYLHDDDVSHDRACLKFKQKKQTILLLNMTVVSFFKYYQPYLYVLCVHHHNGPKKMKKKIVSKDENSDF